MIDGLRRVVFFGAHTDDEMVCAGTLHRMVKSGAEVSVVSMSPAATAGDRQGNQDSVDVVLPEWHCSLDVIGVHRSRRHFPGFTPSADLRRYRQAMCQYVYDFCERERPDAAFVLSPDDENTAHAVLGEECDRVMRGRVPLVVRCQFPWNYTTGRPNLFVKLDDRDFQAKQKVIDCYRSQHFRYQYAKMLLGYATADGLSVKVSAAERFEVVRCVV